MYAAVADDTDMGSDHLPVVLPWLSKSMLDKLEVAQNKALCIITGQYQSTLLEALRVEAWVESYSTVRDFKLKGCHHAGTTLLRSQ